MDQSDEIEHVKLESLTIIDFKRLQKGIISWEIRPDDMFCVISVKDFHEQTTLYQAFQFGFGHDTDAAQAEVIVTLQVRTSYQVEKWNFKHSKATTNGEVEMTYGFQTVGVDVEFREVDQNYYFAKFAELKVSALTQSFCFGGSTKNSLASTNIDLLPFFESYLMGQPLKDDYYDYYHAIGCSAAEKSTKIDASKTIGTIQNGYKGMVEEKQHQADRKRDLWWLQSFFHRKNVEVLENDINQHRARLDNTFDLECEQLIKRISDWEEKMVHYGLVTAIEQNKQLSVLLREKQLKKAQNEIDVCKGQILALQAMCRMSADDVNRFFVQSTLFQHDNVGLIVRLNQTKHSLLLATHGKMTEEIEREYEREIVGKTGGELLGINAIEDNQWYKSLNDEKSDAEAKLKRATLFNAQLYRFKEDGRSLEFYSCLPKNGMCHVESVDSPLFDAEALRNRIIVGGVLDSDDNEDPNEENPFGCKISNDDDDESTQLDVIQSVSSLRLALQSIEKNDFSKLSKSVHLIKDRSYHGFANTDVETPAEDQNTLELKNAVKDMERQLKTNYLASFRDIFSRYDFDNETIERIHRFNRMFISNANAARQQDQLKQNINELNAYQQELQTDKLPNQADNRKEELLFEGQRITEDIGKFVDNACIKLIIGLKEALLAGSELAIRYVNERMPEWEQEPPFDPKAENSSQQHFGCISPHIAAAIDPNAPIGQIFEAVASQMAQIESEMKIHTENNNRIYYDDDELNKMAKKNKRLKKMKNREIVEKKRELNTRIQAFEEPFQHFIGIFNRMAVSQKWISLSYNEPALQSPITMLVHDRDIGLTLQRQPAMLSHQAAALMLKLAINRASRSPILIFDSLDYIIEPNLISPIMKMLSDLTKANAIQVIYMQIIPQPELKATSTHHMWTNTTMNQEEIANTSDLVIVERDVPIERDVSMERSQASAESLGSLNTPPPVIVSGRASSASPEARGSSPLQERRQSSCDERNFVSTKTSTPLGNR